MADIESMIKELIQLACKEVIELQKFIEQEIPLPSTASKKGGEG